jgi:hypothetical protein
MEDVANKVCTLREMYVYSQEAIACQLGRLLKNYRMVSMPVGRVAKSDELREHCLEILNF